MNIALSLLGLLLITASWMQAQTPAPIDTVVLTRSEKHNTQDIAFNASGDRCLTTDWVGTQRLWDVVSGALLNVSQINISLDKNPFIVGDRYYCSGNYRQHGIATLQIHDARTGRVLLTLKDLESFAISEDGSRCLTNSERSVIRLWDVQEGSLIRQYDYVSNMQFVSGSNWMTGSDLGSLSDRTWTYAIWDIRDGGFVGNVFPTDGSVSSYADLSLLVIRESHAITIRDLQTLRVVGSIPVTDREASIQFNSKGDRLVLSDGKTNTLWDAKTYRKIATLSGTSWMYQDFFSPNGTYVIVVLDYGCYVLYNAATGKLISKLDCGWRRRAYKAVELLGDGDPPFNDDLTFSPDDSRLLISPGNGVSSAFPSCHPVLFSTTTGKRIARLQGLQRGTFCDGSDHIIAGTNPWNSNYPDSYSHVLINGFTGKRMGSTLRNTGDEIPSIEYGEVVDTWKNTIQLRDLNTGAVTGELRHDAPIVQLTRSGNRIVTVDSLGCTKLWDATSKRLITTLTIHDVAKALFSPNGQWVFVSNVWFCQNLLYNDQSTWWLSDRDRTRTIRWQVFRAEDGKSMISTPAQWDDCTVAFADSSHRFVVSRTTDLIIYNLDGERKTRTPVQDTEQYPTHPNFSPIRSHTKNDTPPTRDPDRRSDPVIR